MKMKKVAVSIGIFLGVSVIILIVFFTYKASINRPQEPSTPYPYYTEEVTFENIQAHVTLAGTLTLPSAAGNYPAVILISGSGAQNRDEEISGHKPFLIIADHLTKHGIAVLGMTIGVLENPQVTSKQQLLQILHRTLPVLLNF